MTWIRSSGRLDEVHFLYNASLRKYVPDPDLRSLTSATPATSVPAATYLDALAEIRRAVQREPATEWETGLLIRLYAQATGLYAQATDSGSTHAQAEYFTLPVDRGWSREWEWNVLLRLIVEVSEALIWRKYPDQVIALSQLASRLDHLARKSTYGGGPRPPDPIGHLNSVAEQIVLQDGAAMRAIWLASFSRPDTWRRDDLSSELRSLGPDAEEGFMLTCADLARDILANAGPTVTSLTTSVAGSAAADEGTPK